jgi:hypothetical protein
LVPLKGLDMFSDFLHCPIYKFLHFVFFSIKRGFLRLQVLPVRRMDWERLTDGLLDWWIIAFVPTFYDDCNEFPIHAWIEVVHFKTKRGFRVRLSGWKITIKNVFYLSQYFRYTKLCNIDTFLLKSVSRITERSHSTNGLGIED